MPTAFIDTPPQPSPAGPKPLIAGERSTGHHALVVVFVIVPLVALLAAVPVAWGWGLSWLDVGLALGAYLVSGLGITVGFHRYFTHGSFKAHRRLRHALAVAGSLALQGEILDWVADHRRHHAFSDAEGDPHSPWRFGTSPRAVARGFLHAHVGWLFDRRNTNAERFVPDLLADPVVRRVSAQFPLWTLVSLLTPALLGGLASWSWWGALTAFFWAGLVRVAVLHHVTWSVNSICHMLGERPFATRDHSGNVWPLAIASLGESWHNLHHADPTCARHGVRRGQLDISARLIWALERLGWAHDVRWPRPERLARLSAR